ncbi:MAG TPA: L-lactate permease [Candidatus Aphodovivens avistercoris]|nr:L-lactate permease [Candidatus Aphodovivens avistercoris]
MDLLISFIPVIVIVIMIIGFKIRGDIAGVVGWILTLIIAYFFFDTALDIGLIASAKGALASMAVTGMGFFGLLQITFMQESGALQRIVVAIKAVAPDSKACQIMIINVIIGTALVSVGATPTVILSPIMFALGYSVVVSIALPCIGYDSLCTYAMLAAPVVTLSDILTGAGFVMPNGAAPTVQNISIFFSHYLPVITPFIALAMLMMAGGPKLLKEGIVPALITGFGMGFSAMAVSYIGVGIVLTGVIAAAVTFVIMILYMKIRKIKVYNTSVLTEEDREIEKTMPLWKALSPWILLIAFCLVTNFVTPLYDLLYKDWEMRVILFPGDAGQPLRIIWQAFFWVFVSTILASVLIIKPKKGTWKTILQKWNKRWAAPTISSIIYFCIAYVMMYSAYAAVGDGGAWVMVDETKNIISMWANAAADAFGWFYPIANGFLGLVSGFVTGSETSTVALFANYNLISSEILGLNPLVVIASGAVASGLASVITPVKLQQASSSIDKIGSEGAVLRHVIPYALILVTISVVMSQIFALTY